MGADPDEWDALHRLTAAGSKFNTALSARLVRGSRTIGFTNGQRFAFDADGTLAAEEQDRDGRIRFLVEELGISEKLVAELPDDLPVSA